MEDCCGRKKERTEEEKRELSARLGRIAGQANGIRRMVEEDRYCVDILNQLSALDSAVRSLAALLLERHLKSCLVREIREGNLAAADEVIELFKKF